jgi:ADP-heptose:LPS heptosyltransferase
VKIDVMHPQLPAPMRKIAVLRANGIGDLMFALPALDALRCAFPDAAITLLGARWHAAFLADRPGPIDRVLVIPPSIGVNVLDDPPAGSGELEAFFAAMQAERFDLAVQMHGGGRHSNRFVRRLGARIGAGCRTPDAEPLDIELPYVYFQNEILRWIELVGLVGAPPRTIEPHITVTAADRLACPGVPSDRPLVVLNPGAGDPRRRWPTEHFAALGRALAERGCALAISGGLEDQELGRVIAAALPTDTQDLTGKLSLGASAALFERASLVVSNDSGPLHLAAAVGAATVGLFWACNMINGMLPLRRRHRPLVSFRLHCVVCGTDNIATVCEHETSLIGDIPVSEVLAAACDLLNATCSAPRPSSR